jgi:hypothetical protein
VFTLVPKQFCDNSRGSHRRPLVWGFNCFIHAPVEWDAEQRSERGRSARNRATFVQTQDDVRRTIPSIQMARDLFQHTSCMCRPNVRYVASTDRYTMTADLRIDGSTDMQMTEAESRLHRACSRRPWPTTTQRSLPIKTGREITRNFFSHLPCTVDLITLFAVLCMYSNVDLSLPLYLPRYGE